MAFVVLDCSAPTLVTKPHRGEPMEDANELRALALNIAHSANRHGNNAANVVEEAEVYHQWLTGRVTLAEVQKSASCIAEAVGILRGASTHADTPQWQAGVAAWFQRHEATLIRATRDAAV